MAKIELLNNSQKKGKCSIKKIFFDCLEIYSKKKLSEKGWADLSLIF